MFWNEQLFRARGQMSVLADGYRGFWLLVDLNLDRFLYVAALSAALSLGAYFAARSVPVF